MLNRGYKQEELVCSSLTSVAGRLSPGVYFSSERLKATQSVEDRQHKWITIFFCLAALNNFGLKLIAPEKTKAVSYI